MSDDTPFTRAVLVRLDDIRNDVVEVRNDVKQLRDDVQTTYAREQDCIGRHASEREARGDSLKRLWEAVDGQGGRLRSLEKQRDATEGAEVVRSNVWKWVAGIVAAVVAGLLLGWLRGRGSL